MKKLLFLFILLTGPIFAQSINVLIQTQFPSPYLSDWETQPNIVTARITNPNPTPESYYIKATLESDRLGLLYEGTTDPFTVLGGQTYTLDNTTIIDVNTGTINSEVESQIRATNQIPEGIYTLTVELYREGETTPIDGPVSETFYIIGFDRIELLQPTPEEVVQDETQLIFQWTPVVEGISGFSVRYHVAIFEILPGQVPIQVIQSAYPVYETDVVDQTELIYPIDAYGRLEAGKKYIWYVQAYNNTPGPNINDPLGENEGRSEIWSFYYKKRTEEATDLVTLDRLELVTGIAYLKNLNATHKRQTDSEYILDGTATLVVYYLGDSLEVTCTVSNLSFLRGTLYPPTFTGGEVEASFSAGTNFSALSNLPIEFKDVFFSTSTGLQFGLKFHVPSSTVFNKVDLDGRIQLNSAGFSGTVEYTGDWDHSLFQFDHELLKARMTGIHINVGVPSVRADFAFKFFNKDSVMNIPNVDFQYPNLQFTFNQMGPFPIQIIDNVLAISLSNIAGTVSVDASSGNFDFNLGVDAEIQLPYTSTPSMYPEIALSLSKTNGLEVQNFEPHLSENLQFNLGYIQFGLQSLALNTFNFSGGAFQFDFQFDAALLFGGIPNFVSPVIQNIHITQSGFSIAAQDFTNLDFPAIEQAGFRLGLTGFHVGDINFTWASGFTNNWNFSADFELRLPSLPSNFPESLRNQIINLANISLNSSQVTIPIPQLSFTGNQGEIPLGGGAAYLVRTLGGSLEIDFNGGGITENSKLDLTGEIRLPDFMNCSSTQDVTSSVLHMNGYGQISGTINNFAPSCPFNLGIISCAVTTSSLTFSFSGTEQSVVLSGDVTATVPGINPGSSSTANGTLSVNLVTGEILDANITLQNFTLNIPDDSPVLSFTIDEAKLIKSGIQIVGTNQLKVGNSTVSVVFDSLLFNPITMEVLKGQVNFNSNFAFLIGINGGNLSWSTSQILDSMPNPNTLGLNLPSNIQLNTNGLSIAGNSTIHLNVFDQRLDSVQAQFSSDFTIQFKPFKVKSGQVDFMYGGNRVAYLDAGGIHFDLLQFGAQALPARLPLPDTTIAFVQLKQGSTSLIDISNVSGGVQISTRPGEPVKLVIPALKFSNPTAPELDVEFSIVVDPIHFQLISGSISADIPDDLNEFDLSELGIPLSIKHLKYFEEGGIKKFRFTGLPALFGENLSETDSLVLELGEDGRFLANWNLNVNKSIPIMGEDAPFRLGVTSVQGNLDFSYQNLSFALTSSAAIQMEKNTNFEDLITFNLDISQTGFAIRDVTPSSQLDSLPLDLGAARITFSDFTIPLLSYSKSSGWDFQFEFSAAFDFPQFGDFQLPPIEHVTIGTDGIHFPQTSLADLNLPEFNLGGFGLKITSFRIPDVTVDIFHANIDFGSFSNMRFDLELNMPQAAAASLPPEFSSLGLSITDAGFSHGVLLGNIQLKNITDPGLAIPMGGATFFATQFGGSLYADSSGTVWVQKFDVTVLGRFQLPTDLFPCATPQEISTALHINSQGQINGSISNFVPSCPLDFGPVTLTVNNSTLTFDISSGEQSAILAMAATLHMPSPTPGDSISASGNITLDLLSGKFIDGQIAINQPFKLSLPLDGDVLVFTINSAVLNTDGLNISGSQTLNISPSMSITATFANFQLQLNPFKITGGEVDFASSFAFKVDIVDGELKWRASESNPTLDSDFGIAVDLPDTMGIRNGNFYANGTSTVTLNYAGETYNAITARFRDGFELQFKPLRVKNGRVEFINNNEVIAYIDSTGFVPGNVLAAFPLPDSIAIPSMDIAYINLKDSNGDLLVETTTTSTAYVLQIKPGKTLSLKIPALAYGGDVPEIQITSLSIGLNKTTFQPVSGSISVQAPTNGELLDLQSKGIPLKLTRFEFKNINGSYAVVLGAKIALPEAMGNMDLTVDSLSLSSSGISGTVTVGDYNEYYSASATYLNALSLTGEVPVQVKVSGIQASFSSGSFQIRFSGDLLVDMFKDQGETDPAPIHFAADVGSDSTNFNIDISHLTNGIPLQIARLKALADETNIPPIKIQTSGSDFAIELNTLLEIPSFGEGFAVEVRGLRISTNNGLQFPTVTFNNPSEYLNFELFAMQFTIDNLGFFYETKGSGKVFGINLGGSLTVMENTSTFSGLKIGSDGSFSIASASLISSPIEIVQNTLSIQSLEFQNDSLRASFHVTPPQPLDQSPSTIHVMVAPDGTVSGGGQIVGINETQGLGNGDGTEWTFWKGTLDLTYMVVNLDFGNINTSNVQLISDLWVGEQGGRVELGYKSGGQVHPGLQIDFDGDVSFANYRVQGTVEFDLEVLKFTVTNLTPLSGSDFGVSLSGGVELDISSASSNIQFQNLEISKEGGMPNIGSAITGGDLTIGSVFSFSISAFQFEPNGGTVNISMGTLPSISGGSTTDASTSSESITVDSYVEFGVSMSMGSSFSGGVDRFLLFYKDGSPNILIKNLHLSIQDVISGSLDLKYVSSGSNFSFLGAGQFDFRAVQLSLVAVFEKENANLRFGMFAAAEIGGGGITVFPGINVIKLGGGFFYNPKQEYLDIVMSKTDLNGDSTLTALPPIQGELKFAAFLYAGISIANESTFKATTLITITDQYIDIAGKATLLNQENKLKGKMKFTALFTSFYITGFVDVQAKLGVIEGSGRVDFRLAETDWYLKGNVHGHIVNKSFLQADLKFFIGNPGFMVKAEVNSSFNFWIIKVSSKVGGMVWMKFQEPREFGAFFEFRLKAEVLLGLASIEGNVKAILIISDRFILYGEAGGKVCIAWGLKCWSGSVWLKISNKSPKFDGGFGSDPEMAAKIAAAENMADEMENAANQAQQELVNKLIQTTQLTDEDIKTAGLNLYAADPEAVTAGWLSMENANGGLTSQQSSVLNNLRNNYIILPSNLKSQSQMLASLINLEKQFVDQAEQMAETISERINQRLQDLPPVDQMLPDYAFDSPIQLASDSVEVVTYTDAEGHEHQTFQVKPQLQIDDSKVEQHQERAQEMEDVQQRILEQIYDRILAMNENLKQIDFILLGAQGGVSINELGKKFQLAHEKLEKYYLEKQEYLYELASFAASRASGISGLRTDILNVISSKNAGISNIDVARNLAKARARALMNLVYLGNPSEAQKAGDSLAANVDGLDNINDVKTVCTNLGRQLWYEIPASGLTQLSQSMDTAVVNNTASRHKAVGALEQRQVQITQSIDKVYDMRISYAQALYDLCDRYLYWQLGYTPEVDIEVLGNSPTGTTQGNIVNYIQSNIYSGYQATTSSATRGASGLNSGLTGGKATRSHFGSGTSQHQNSGGSLGNIIANSGIGLVSTPASFSSFKGVGDLGLFLNRTDDVFVKIGDEIVKPVHLDVKVLRDKLAQQLIAPEITSISVRAFKNPHSGYIIASFNARHPTGIANFAYTITDAYHPPSSGGNDDGIQINTNFNFNVNGISTPSGPFYPIWAAPMALPQINLAGSVKTQPSGSGLATGGTNPAILEGLQSGIVQFANENYGVYSTSFKLIGDRTNLNSYFLPMEPNETSHEYALKIRARSTGGFVNRRLANFTVEFGGSQRDQQTGSYAMLEDNTPPQVLRVTIPKYQYATDRIFNIHVEAVDYESDVTEVAYTISENSTLTQPDSANWKAVYNRRDFNAMELDLDHLHRYYVFVKVKNSVGLWSTPKKSNPVLIDTTSPGTPTITFTAPLPDATPGVLPPNAITDYNQVAQTLEHKISKDHLIQFSITSSQQPKAPENEDDGTDLFSVYQMINIASIIKPDTIPPGIRVHFDPASDMESGIEQYVYKVTGSATDPAPNSGWRVLGVDESGNPIREIVIVGEPLAYLDSFYVHIRAMNKAGLLGPAVSTGPIRPKDPTKPMAPEVNFGDEYTRTVLYNASTNNIVLGFKEGTDYESGIKEYQVKIGTTPGGNDILDWTSNGVNVYYGGEKLGEITEPASLFPSSGGNNYSNSMPGSIPTQFGGMFMGSYYVSSSRAPNRISIDSLNLQNGSKVYVSVRAINGDGVPSDVSTTDKIIIDNTSPSNPIITTSYDPANKSLTVTVSNLRDNESGVIKIKVGIKSTNNVMPTYKEIYKDIIVISKHGNTVPPQIVTFNLESLPGTYRYPDEYQIKAVAVNRANLKSPIVTSVVRVGSTVIPPGSYNQTPAPIGNMSTGSVPNLGNPFSTH